MIRPAVVLRKNSQSNRSDRGAATQAVLMSVYRTLKLRGLNPTKTIADALKTYLTTGKLPPLPDENTADGLSLTANQLDSGRQFEYRCDLHPTTPCPKLVTEWTAARRQRVRLPGAIGLWAEQRRVWFVHVPSH